MPSLLWSWLCCLLVELVALLTRGTLAKRVAHSGQLEASGRHQLRCHLSLMRPLHTFTLSAQHYRSEVSFNLSSAFKLIKICAVVSNSVSFSCYAKSGALFCSMSCYSQTNTKAKTKLAQKKHKPCRQDESWRGENRLNKNNKN